jgi:hypothetical protein
MSVTLKNAVFWDITPCGFCTNRRLGGNYPTMIRVTRIGEQGTKLAVTITLLMKSIHSFETSVLTRATRSDIQEDDILQF